MRALVLTLLAAALIAGGFVWYLRSQTAAPQSELFAPAPELSLPTAADCTVRDAVYEYNDDRRLMLHFRQVPSTQDNEAAPLNGQQIGNMAFVVHITSFGDDYVFLPVSSGLAAGPQYQTTVVRVRPEAGGPPFEVAMFDTDMRYIAEPPRDHTTAPAYIYMPGMLPILYRGRVDQPPGMFRFQRCEAQPAPAQ